MRNLYQCENGHIYKNGSQVNDIYLFHFEKYPIYKFLCFSNILFCVSIFIALLNLIEIFYPLAGKKIIFILSVILLACLFLRVVAIMILFLHPTRIQPNKILIKIIRMLLRNYMNSNWDIKIYQLNIENVKKIRYRKHWLYPGYSITIPEFRFKAEIKSHHNTENIEIIDYIVKKHTIHCVKDIEVLENALKEIKKEEAIIKLKE